MALLIPFYVLCLLLGDLVISLAQKQCQAEALPPIPGRYHSARTGQTQDLSVTWEAVAFLKIKTGSEKQG